MVRAHHEDLDRRVILRPLDDSFHIAVHPAEHRRRVVDGRAAAEVPVARLAALHRADPVGPGAENQPRSRPGRPRPHQAPVVGHGAARPVRLVEPAREIEHRGADAVVAPLERGPAPPRVPGRMAHPFVVPRRDALEVRQREQRAMPPGESAITLPRGRSLFVGARAGATQPATKIGGDVEPGPVEPRAIPHATGIPEALRGGVRHRGHHGLERGRPLHGGEPLNRGGVGEPDRADGAIRPRLACGPLDGVVAVLPLVP